jgi:serine/threonine protein kinase/tetratricopeptide (TPR) repeat protein
MSSVDRRARVDALFDAALDLPPAARAAFLAEACAGGPELRADVEELLALAADAAPELDHGIAVSLLRDALAVRPDAPAAGDHGRCFGAWKVVGELGQGGMGNVYLVERADGEFRQQAALKLVRLGIDGGTGSTETFFRFELERQILASLNHANIARLLDGGRSEDGRPFLVMEYVEGEPIDRYCDAKRLDVEGRLALFVQVGRAVQHAHRNLVVHRDLKPSNIIVTAEGEPKLLDFGIARLLSPGEAGGQPATRTLARLLTPEYASPEQVRGEAITTASDVYQLGLLLSELLTGQRAQPVAASSPTGVERAICDTPALRPSAQLRPALAPEIASLRSTTPAVLARRLRGDLDAIVLFALRKEPERRYASVGDLLDDIERHRRGLPVRARPDTFAYRFRKLVARRRVALAWALVVSLAASWGVAAFTVQRLRAAREAKRAEQVEEVIGNLFSRVNPRSGALAGTPRDYIAEAAAVVRNELRDQPRSQSRLLQLLGRVGILWALYEPASELLEEALALRVATFGPDSAEVGDSLHWLAQSQHYLGRYEDAERNLRRALAIHHRRLGADDPASLHIAMTLGDVQHTRGRLTDAEATLRSTLAALGPGGNGDLLATGRRDLANVLRDRGALQESEAAYRESLGTRRGPVDAQVVAITELYFARLLILRGRFAEAEPLLAGNLAKLRQIYDGDHPVTAIALRDLGYLRLEQGRLEEAEAHLEQAQRIFRSWLGGDHPMVPRAAAVQAELARRGGRLEESVRLSRATLAQFQRLGLGEHPAAIDTCRTLGEALGALGRHPEAAVAVAPCLAVAERQFVAGDRRTAGLRRTAALPTS